MDESSTGSDPRFEWKSFNSKNQLVDSILPTVGVHILKTSSALRHRKFMKDHEKLTNDGKFIRFFLFY
jgi:hypothetical protein